MTRDGAGGNASGFEGAYGFVRIVAGREYRDNRFIRHRLLLT
jgi:hypothetical protein